MAEHPSRGPVSAPQAERDPRRPVLWVPLLVILGIVVLSLLGARGFDDGAAARAAAGHGTDAAGGAQAGQDALVRSGGADDGHGADDGAHGKADRGAPVNSAKGSAVAEDGASGELTAGGAALLPAPADGAGAAGEQATGRGLRVLAVTPQGFFVGTDDANRVYVELGGEVGEDEGEPRPEQGDVVDLRGPVRPAPEDPARTLELSEQDARLVESQGFFVNADEVVVR